MKDMVGSGQVQTCSASLDGEDEDGPLAVGRRRLLDHPVALGFGSVPVNQEYLETERFFKGPVEILAHFGELSENQGTVAGLDHFLTQIVPAE
jgi:hypothetical protein